jgi:hypothetical protein
MTQSVPATIDDFKQRLTCQRNGLVPKALQTNLASGC